ncbi:MAG: hypothetical protein JJU33_14390 [Phycisphaerales bacterium]|nr:hypothetical protein [Phycisphaerales bacterium]
MKALWLLFAAALVMLLLILPLRLIGTDTPAQPTLPGEHRLAEALRLAERDGRSVVVFFDVVSPGVAPEFQAFDRSYLDRLAREMLGHHEVRAWIDEHAYLVRSSSFSRRDQARFERTIRAEAPHRGGLVWVVSPDVPPRATPHYHPRYVASFLEAARTNVPPQRYEDFWRQKLRGVGRLKRLHPEPASIEEAREYTRIWWDVNFALHVGEARSIRIGELRENPYVRQAFDELRRDLMEEYKKGSISEGERWAMITMMELQERDEGLAFIIPILDDPDANPGLQYALMNIDEIAVVEAGRPDLFVKYTLSHPSWEDYETLERDRWIALYEWELNNGEQMFGDEWDGGLHYEIRLAALHTGQLMLGREADAESTLKALAAAPGSDRLVPTAIAMAAKLDQLRPMHKDFLDPDNPEHAAWIEKINAKGDR